MLISYYAATVFPGGTLVLFVVLLLMRVEEFMIPKGHKLMDGLTMLFVIVLFKFKSDVVPILSTTPDTSNCSFA